MSHIFLEWMSHVNESCEWDMWMCQASTCNISESRVVKITESCHTQKWSKLSPICTSQITHMNKSRHTYTCVTSHAFWRWFSTAIFETTPALYALYCNATRNSYNLAEQCIYSITPWRYLLRINTLGGSFYWNLQTSNASYSLSCDETSNSYNIAVSCITRWKTLLKLTAQW